MKIWVDADAAPRAVKDMLYRAANRTKIPLILVANAPLAVPTSAYIRSVVVAKGFDVADEHIVEQIEAGDLLITQDVPLAAAAVERGATCIGVRGEIIDASNASTRLALRDIREEQWLSGELMGGPKAFGDKDKRRFAAALDRWLAKATRA